MILKYFILFSGMVVINSNGIRRYDALINNWSFVSFIVKIILFKNIGNAKIYKEYEFIYNHDLVKRHGIIDLMLEYDNYIDIIDYKLKNIDDKNYLKQLEGYMEYIKSISNKDVNIYLYSLIDKKYKKLN